jgi:uncharacterized protein with GYD domain
MEVVVPAYLWRGSYTAEGAKGLAREGGSKRRDAVTQMVEKAGGKMIAFYFALGDADVVGIAEFPDAATAAAVSIAVNLSGQGRLSFDRSRLPLPHLELLADPSDTWSHGLDRYAEGPLTPTLSPKGRGSFRMGTN